MSLLTPAEVAAKVAREHCPRVIWSSTGGCDGCKQCRPVERAIEQAIRERDEAHGADTRRLDVLEVWLRQHPDKDRWITYNPTLGRGWIETYDELRVGDPCHSEPRLRDAIDALSTDIP